MTVVYQRRVYLGSPYRGDVEKNTAYAKEAMRDSLGRGECPLVPHLLYTQVLDDENPSHRELGIQAAVEWISVCDVVVMYTDLGISDGMKREIAVADLANKKVFFRSIGEEWG